MKNHTSEAEWMESGYDRCYYTGPLRGAWSIVHRKMERRFDSGMAFPKVIELGAGHGQHAPFVRHDFHSYVVSDLQEDLIVLPEGDPRFSTATLDAADLSSIPDGSVDRLIATCLLAHLPDPMAALAEWRRVVRPGGVLTIYVPCEPGWITRLIRRCYIWPRARRHGLKDPELLMYESHKIHYPAMRSFIRATFQGDAMHRERFPTGVLPWNLSLFEVVQVQRST